MPTSGCTHLCSCPAPEQPDCEEIVCDENATPVCEGDELCRCNPPYIGDGFECVKDCTFNGETIPVSCTCVCLVSTSQLQNYILLHGDVENSILKFCRN